MQIEENLKRQKAIQVAHKPRVVVPSASKIHEVVLAMAREEVGYALLTDGSGALEGMLTERHILLDVAGREGAMEQPASEFMVRDLPVLDENDSVAKAIHYMHSRNSRFVPIVHSERENQAVGVIRQMDIVQYLSDHFQTEILNLPPDPDRVSETREGA